MAMVPEHSVPDRRVPCWAPDQRPSGTTSGVARSGPIAILIVVLASLCSCAAQVDSGPPPPGSISGSIAYDGPAAGGGRPLAIAVYRTFPPSGPPVAWTLVETYAFPFRYSFDGLPPGTYFVGAAVDVDPADTRYVGMLNAERDPHGYALEGGRIEVTSVEGSAGADIRLEDQTW